MGDWGRWAARGGLYLPIGLFGVPMSPGSVSHRPRRPERRLTNTVNIRPMPLSYVVSSMSPIVSVITSHGWQTRSRKVDQSAKPGNATLHRCHNRMVITIIG